MTKTEELKLYASKAYSTTLEHNEYIKYQIKLFEIGEITYKDVIKTIQHEGNRAGYNYILDNKS